MKFCAQGGFLVSSALVLPSEASTYQANTRVPPVGCNQLFCKRCGHFVRNVVGWRFSPGRADAENAARRIATLIMAFAVEDWRTLADRPDFAGVFEVSPALRVYLCECGSLNVAEWIALREPSRGESAEWEIPWYCNGHPAS